MLCATEFPFAAQNHLLDAIRTVLEIQRSQTQPQEQKPDARPLKIDLLENLLEIVQTFQLRVLNYEHELEKKVTESEKLIIELEHHF